ncbi:MAG TPA: amidohydrolase family protein [Salinivirgaceae bacterium]|nr:amidohydrolase family protein [Salinivirgaceae bacterium]HQA76466.1 amidohydrolase family protein [Salinivirgaceae bacterium]
MRKIAATYIYPIVTQPIKYGVLYLDDNNTIVKIKDNGGEMIEEQGCEYYNGVIVPGFVNAHTHLELSHLKGFFKKGAGMRNFLQSILTRPKTEISEITEYAEQYDRLMYNQGIVAVGDISNTLDTLEIKSSSKIYYHTFVELFGLAQQKSADIYNKGVSICDAYKQRNLAATITPHAPYSLSKSLLQKICTTENNQLLSIHILENSIEQESLSDNKQSLKSIFHSLDASDIENITEHPFQLMLQDIKNSRVLTVHNTHATAKDWDIALNIAQKNNISLFAVTCPRSNIFINNLLPDYSQWSDKIPICIGTDSLSSNTDLSILNEILFLLKKTNFSFDELLKWGTLNGAKALGVDKKFGSFEIGKTPGISLITQFDYIEMKPTDNATICRIV